MSAGPGDNCQIRAFGCEAVVGACRVDGSCCFEGSCAVANRLPPSASAASSTNVSRLLIQELALRGGTWKAVSPNFIPISSRCPGFIGCLSRFSMSECNGGSPEEIAFILVNEFRCMRHALSL